GDDIYIGENTVGFGIISEGFDPDGFIVSYFWEELTNNGAVIQNPHNSTTNITGLTEDFYTFRVTVTDNDGATASDTVNVYRGVDVGITLTNIKNNVYELNGNSNKEMDWRLDLDSSIGNGSINIQGVADIKLTKAHTRLYIIKNGTPIWYRERLDENATLDFSIFILEGDVIE